MSVWLPQNLEQIEQIEALATNQQTPVSGILISPYSFNDKKILGAGSPKGSYGELYPLVYNVWASRGYGIPLNHSQAPHFIDGHPQFKSLSQRYPHKQPLFSYGYIMYYSNRPVVEVAE